MKRKDLEHIIRAAGAIAHVDKLVVLGSQAILGLYPDPPKELLVSQEVDTYPLEQPQKADLIDGTMGELSPFHEEFGYYAHGVGPETALLPRNWQDRLVAVNNVNTNGVTGLCLHPADLAVSKLLAGREKDLCFVAALLKFNLISEEQIHELTLELSESDAAKVRSTLVRCKFA